MEGLSRAICIPRSVEAAQATTTPAPPPRELLEEWLAARRFEPHGGIPQWPCDDELERGYFLFSNSRWVVLLYSGIDARLQEDNRLLLHLARAGTPLLYVWSAEAAWGYRIHEGREVLDAYYSGYDCSPEWLTEYAGHGDLQFLCETFGFTARPERLKQIRDSRVIAREDVVARFCEEVGIAPASAPYEAVEWHFLTRDAASTFDGWSMERGYYVKQGFRPGVATSLKLHEIPARAQTGGRTDGWWPSGGEIDPQFLLGIRRLFALIGVILLPVRWLMLTIFKTALWTDRFYRFMGWNQRSMHPTRFARELLGERPHAPFEVDGTTLTNSLRRCALTIPKGAKALPLQCPGVFAFSISRVVVNCDAVRPDAEGHIRRMFFYPPGFAIIADEMFMAGPHPARLIAWKHEEEQRLALSVYHWIVQTPGAYFEFSCGIDSADRAKEVVPLVRQVVETFRLTDDVVIAGPSAEAAPEAAATKT